MPGAGALHGLIAFLVCKLLDAYVSEHDLGLVSADNTGYVLSRDPDVVRIPDVSFVSWERVPEEGVPEGYWPMAPDLAVEIVSPNDRADDVREKVWEYLEAGTRQVWVLWPRQRAASVYRKGAPTLELGAEDSLEGGEVLPGFRVRVSDLFEVRRKR